MDMFERTRKIEYKYIIIYEAHKQFDNYHRT